MKRIYFIGVILFLTLVMSWSINSNAMIDDFDANYYANKYPDVVNALGSDPEVLYEHYLTFGIYEGRFKSQEDEIENYLNPELKSEDTIPPDTETTVVTITPLYDTYIDVDIENQLVTYFKDGTQLLQSPCVTGRYNSNYSTPVGEFSIKTKIPGKRLKGPTWDCWVDYWMRFTDTACGFHDASWRSEFGGEIYKTNGSHGCVNLPKDFAKELYNNISIETKVVVH